MKAYTDLEQSKKLIEILPLESADMFLALNGTLPVMSKYIDGGLVTADNTAVPCWSFAALFNVLPNNKHINTTISRGSWKVETAEYLPNIWWCEYENEENDKEINISADNPVDACYKMIMKLNELNLL